jgi:hypothetical protein
MTWANKESYFDRVLEDSAGITVEDAVIREPGGFEHPGVAFRNAGFPKFVLTAEAAHRVAVELVEALERLKQEKPVKRAATVNDRFDGHADN